jgi:predicted nucleic acid-binding protein
MTLAEVPRSSAVFVDANIFIYHFAGRSDDCSAFLTRIEAGEVRGFTGQTILLEVAHRLMIIEAAERGFTLGSNPSARLAQRRDLVRQLSKYHFSVAKISRMRIDVLALPDEFLSRSQEYRQTHGLLVNDSLIPMQMREAGVSILASGDTAFDRVPWIKRAAPQDV